MTSHRTPPTNGKSQAQSAVDDANTTVPHAGPTTAPNATPKVPFRVLVVCTANVCRSRIAEALLLRTVSELELPWSVRSAGTHPKRGDPIDPKAREVLRELDLTPRGRGAQPVTKDLVTASHLILTAEAFQRHAVVELDVHALSRTFTLVQFARLSQFVELETHDVSRLGHDLLAGARLARGRVQPGFENDDIADPVGKRMRHFRACRDQVRTAIDAIMRPVAQAPAVRTGSEADAGAGDAVSSA